MKLTIAEINGLGEEEFVGQFGAVFEHSPWVARAAWREKPFRNAEDLLLAMKGCLREAHADEQLALIRAHPDLVGRAAREGTLAPASASEQAGAGLDRLDAQEGAWFERQNQAYQERFGFPFIICVRANRKSSIREGFMRRLGNSAGEEIEAALTEIEKIAAFRMGDLVADEGRR